MTMSNCRVWMMRYPRIRSLSRMNPSSRPSWRANVAFSFTPARKTQCWRVSHPGADRGLPHHRHETLAVDGWRPLPGDRDDSVPDGQHRNGRDVLQTNVFGLPLFVEAIVQVEDPPLHGNVTDQLFARSLGKTMGLSETEHLLDRFLVGEAGDVVERLALSRLETGAARGAGLGGGPLGHG